MMDHEEIRDALARCREAIAEHDPHAWPRLTITLAANYPESTRIGSALAYYINAKTFALVPGPRKRDRRVSGYGGSIADAERGFYEDLAAAVTAHAERMERRRRKAAAQ